MALPSAKYSVTKMLNIGKSMMIPIITFWTILQGIFISSGSKTKNGSTKVRLK
jgi:hypothetical protein